MFGLVRRMIYGELETRGRKNGYCSFCRKSYREVGLLFKGQGQTYICGECIDLFRPILIQKRRRAQQASKSTPGVAPNEPEPDSSVLATVKAKELLNSLDVRLKAVQRLLLCHRAERRQQWREMQDFWDSGDFEASRDRYGYKRDDGFLLAVPTGYEDMLFFDYAGGYACAMLLVSFFSEFLDELWLLSKESGVAAEDHRSFEHLPIHRKFQTFEQLLSLSLDKVADSMAVIHKLVIDRNYVVHRGGIWDERYMARPGALPLVQYNLDRRHIYIADEYIDKASAAIRAVCQYICEHLAPRLQRTAGV